MSKIPPSQINNAVFDKTTGIPIFHYYLDQVSEILKNQHALGILYISLGEIITIEEEYGSEIYENILEKIGELIKSLSGSIIRTEDLIAIAEIEPDAFIIFLNQKRTSGEILPVHLEAVADRTYRYLSLNIYKITRFYTSHYIKVEVGFQLVIENAMIHTRRLICRSIADAREIAEYHSHKMYIRIRQDIEHLIQNPTLITTEYQPIVEFTTNRLIGYEALTRGPKDTELSDPNFLFALAEDVNLISQFDHVCRRLALEKMKGLETKYKLFINVFPTTIYDSKTQREELMLLLKDLGFLADNVVLEISEKYLIKSYSLFKEASKHYTDIGFSISVDDAGTGYSSLQMISEIRPKFIKIDMSIIRDIHLDNIKRELVKALNEIGKAIHADLIAEGIEKKEELKLLQDLGIKFGQGYLFARPAYPAVKKI